MAPLLRPQVPSASTPDGVVVVIGHLQVVYQRHWIIWVTWRLEYVYAGQRHLVAKGASVRRKNADNAIEHWRRVWLRRHGLL